MELKESKHPKPQSDEDALTVELRNEFALLNKIFELREIARDTSKQKLNRKAAKAAIKETKKKSNNNSNNNSSLKAPKLAKPSSPPRKPEGEWIKKLCWRCNSQFSIHSHWLNPPSLCKPCAKDLDETYLPSSPDHSIPYSKVHFVSGGAPGLGKRK